MNPFFKNEVLNETIYKNSPVVKLPELPNFIANGEFVGGGIVGATGIG